MTVDALAPADQLRQMNQTILPHLLFIAAELGLADLVRDQARSSTELAHLIDGDERALERVLRGLAGFGIFQRDAQGRISLNALSQCLLTDHPSGLRAQIRFTNHPAMQHGWASIMQTLQDGQPSFQRVYGVTVFDYCQAHPELGERFNSFMERVFNQGIAAIVAACDLHDVRTVIDVGGGTGSCLIAMLTAAPHVRGVIVDLPYSRAAAEAALDNAGLSNRCQFVEGSFFEELPAGGDRYVLKHILHDWDDQRCLTILRQCRRAMLPGGRVLIMESLFPAGPLPDRGAVISDLIMLALFGGQERTRLEYEQLLAAAQLQLVRVIPTATPVSILEARPV